MNYLNLFSLGNLAMLSDWLEETGELYVDVYFPHSGNSGTAYFIRSLNDLKSLVLLQNWPEIVFTVLRRLQFSLRGVADEQLLEKALQQIPDGHPYEIVNLRYYPENRNFCGSGKSHDELRRELSEVFGEIVGIGQEPDVFSGKLSSNVDEVFEVHVLRKNEFQIIRNQDAYERFSKEPNRYQWIANLWHE
ncbi:MAG: hypothetical protein H6672_20505 [Anaerolineaceae bacterium]|nr:hypothetical protein [Anaerolineaceae bacterium]